MNENKEPLKENISETDETANIAEETAQSSDQADLTNIEELNNLKAELEAQKAKAEDYYNHLQRLKAEFDNYRRRTQKEKEDIFKYASERIILSLLPVLDNFDRAVESSQEKQDFEAYAQGVAMILKQFRKVLEDEGLKAIEAVGKEFDPNLHEALLKEESDQGENIVLEEIQKGYILKDKVIRPSKVKVSG
ncbi:MAG TPA: nucleotide exchange factor GrpE [Peptococcaceae bacterium]|nr:nucleotide exchange factor GrpE [Peptococcaceae bacterium]